MLAPAIKPAGPRTDPSTPSRSVAACSWNLASLAADDSNFRPPGAGVAAASIFFERALPLLANLGQLGFDLAAVATDRRMERLRSAMDSVRNAG
jgi:hypothetical protein